MIFAPKFPVKISEGDGFANVDTVKELVFFHLKNLLFTFPGEKISNPDYGVGIKQYLFELGSQSRLNFIADQIADAINLNLRYLNLRRVTVTSPNSDATININISYSLPNSDTIHTAIVDAGSDTIY